MDREVENMLKIYLDNCCYNRPFDDRSNIKNYLEREAVLIIMQLAFDNHVIIIGSDIIQKEMAMISNLEKRKNVETLYHELAAKEIKVNEEIIRRAETIMAHSTIKAFDSLHFASAETEADILLTTDKKFLKSAGRMETKLKISNPIDFLMEVMENDDNNSFKNRE